MECRFGYVNLILQRKRLAKDILIENELTLEPQILKLIIYQHVCNLQRYSLETHIK
jgi:hypothetical protein